ncbi:chromosomal replication initiator DnaA [Chakrabartia godavariana]|nr:chromosomal replication initiator DnaA [Chakrabartia godavariana]
MTQIGLPFDWPAQEDQSDFIVTPSNDAAVRHLDRWGGWPVRAGLLVGPRKSGKSLLGRIFAARSGGVVIDDAERKAEADLFHAWNAAQETRIPLLIIAEQAPPAWEIRLPDLRSRLAATPIAEIGLPDAPLTESLLAKMLSKRGLVLPPEVAAYVAARLERSYLAIQRAADALDAASLSRKRGLTVPLAREAMMAQGLMD